jgi:3'(2'), 5'-bisphosphate nucleotidase
MSHELLEPMVEAVRAAARICRAVQHDLVRAGALEKSDRSPVTIADLAAQAVVAERLATSMSGVPLMGEEDSRVLSGDERKEIRLAVLERARTEWPTVTEIALLRAIDRGASEGGASGSFLTLDPVDGTKGFLRGEQYAVALALVEDGRERLGVLGCPNLPGPDGSTGLVHLAARGGGAFRLALDGPGLSGDPIRVSARSLATELRFCQSVEAAHSDGDVSRAIAERLGVTAEPVRMDSQCKYALLAQGQAEVYLRIPRDRERSECVWDHAAGGVILEEAGGRVTDLDGKALDFGAGRTLLSNRGIVATNGPLHDAVLDAIRAVGG